MHEPHRACAAAGAAARPATTRARPHRRDRCSPSRIALAAALALIFTWSRTLTRFENRPMAPWPAPALAREFPAAFDRAFSDRFGGRDTLVRAPSRRAAARCSACRACATVMLGTRRLVLLARRGRPLARPPLSRHAGRSRRARSTARSRELVRRSEWLAARGIAYVVVVVPEKFTIYPEHLPVVGRALAAADAVRSRARRARARRPRRLRRSAPAAASPRRRASASTTRPTRTGTSTAPSSATTSSCAPCSTSSPAGCPRSRRAKRPALHGRRRLLQRRPAADARHAVASCARTTWRRSARCSRTTRARCARRIDKDEFPGFEFYACDKPGPAARGRAARLDGDLADSAAVGELQPRRVRRARARSTAR